MSTASRTSRKVIVTGSTGLVGSSLVNVNQRQDQVIEWIGVSSKDGDLRDYNQVVNMLSKIIIDHGGSGSIDGIIHLAANVGGLFKNMAYPVEMLEDNLLMNTNILKAAHALDIDNVVVCLSTCIFPDDVGKFGYPITTNMLHYGPPHPSNEGYAHAKRMCDVATRAYQKQYGRRYFCVVPTNIYGPHDNFDLQNAHVIPALIHKCYLAKQAGEPFVVAGDGTPLRQFIYSDDVARLMVWAYLNYETISKPFIMCPPNSEVPISHVVDIIAKEFDYVHRVVYDTSRPNGQYKKTAYSGDVEKAQVPCISVDDGLIKTVIWFKNNMTLARMT